MKVTFSRDRHLSTETTHLIVGKLRPTEKLISAMVRGIWILPQSYLVSLSQRLQLEGGTNEQRYRFLRLWPLLYNVQIRMYWKSFYNGGCQNLTMVGRLGLVGHLLFSLSSGWKREREHVARSLTTKAGKWRSRVQVFFLIPKQCAYIRVCLPDGTAKKFSYHLVPKPGFETHVIRVAPTRDL